MTDEAPQATVLVVDDDPVVVRSMSAYLESLGYRTQSAGSAAAALEAIDAASKSDDPADAIAVMVCDVAMPGTDGLELQRELRRRGSKVATLFVTGYGTIEQAVEAIRLGAIDYLTKPVVDDELRLTVERAVQQHALCAESASHRGPLDQDHGLEDIVGVDRRMQKIYEVIQAVASSKTTVLMTGESGTGKSLIARAIHRQSPRAEKPFVEIACGSIPETLLESELFGHVKGAFTGAHADKVGRFLAADGGTIFLDEINSASPGMQLKLLRVLQERCFEPVGSNETQEVDVRVILASNQPLEGLVAKGGFRQDLYYRINVVSIVLPPLRDRVADVPTLAEHFLAIKAQEVGKQVLGFDEAALDALRRYAWPGNVRELENVIERAVVLTRGVRISPDDLPEHVLANETRGLLTGEAGRPEDSTSGPGLRYLPGVSLKQALEEPEQQIILAALEANDWNRQRTAEQLEINRTTLYKKIKQYDLERFGETG